VGEVDTAHKFKYGPRGLTVNLTSRVQGATKYLRVPALVTGATRSAPDDSFAARRLTRVRMVNIAAPVDVYELSAGTPADGAALRVGYGAEGRGGARATGTFNPGLYPPAAAAKSFLAAPAGGSRYIG
jgi:hypothetical protein